MRVPWRARRAREVTLPVVAAQCSFPAHCVAKDLPETLLKFFIRLCKPTPTRKHEDRVGSIVLNEAILGLPRSGLGKAG